MTQANNHIISYNWRAFVTFFVAIAPAFPGYILSCANIGGQPDNLQKVSRLGFMTGFLIALVLYPLLCMISPPPGLGEGEAYHDEDTFVLPSAYDQSRPTQGKYSVVDSVDEGGSRESDNDHTSGEKNGSVTREKDALVL